MTTREDEIAMLLDALKAYWLKNKDLTFSQLLHKITPGDIKYLGDDTLCSIIKSAK